MGAFDIYCGFWFVLTSYITPFPNNLYLSNSAGPFDDVRRAWLDYVLYNEATIRANGPYPADDGQWMNPPGFPVPTKPVEEIVTISKEDGQFFEDFVCVSPLWDDYVSPLWYANPSRG
jgi:hypothetical protein